MKRLSHILLGMLIPILGASPAFSKGLPGPDLLEELRALRKEHSRLEERIRKLEAELSVREAEPQEKLTEEPIHEHGAAGVKGLDDRVRTLEERVDQGLLGKVSDRISLSGLLEVEASYENHEGDDTSDLVLATAELGVDVQAMKHLGGHVLFLWEEGETEPVDLDEGFIILDGADILPLYLNAGKMYVPFGRFESHFISDPLTLELGETRETAVEVGFLHEWCEVFLSGFNGDIEETGKDDHLTGFAAGMVLSLPPGTIPDHDLQAGISYIRNLGESDGLQESIPSGSIRDPVGGVSAFLSVSFRNRFFLEAEYVGALDGFASGEMDLGPGRLKPKAWNFEFAFVPFDAMEFGLKYEGSDDAGDFLPERQYGAVIHYRLFEYASLGLEYLRGELKGDLARDLVTTQLALEF